MATFKEALTQRACIGTLISIDSADVAEILARAGYDWLFIDLEHAAISIGDVKHMLRAARAANPACAVLARVPLNDVVWLKQALDAGCDGVIIPQINSVAEAQAAVAHTKYRPVGERGIGIGRAQSFGASLKEYVADANNHILTVVQIEHADAVANIDAILGVQGIDAAFVGPYDLSDSMGIRGEMEHPKLKEAIATVARACAAKSIPAGIFAATPAAAKARMAEGFRLIAAGTDALALHGTAQEALRLMRG